jgi:hypothetical protein
LIIGAVARECEMAFYRKIIAKFKELQKTNQLPSYRKKFRKTKSDIDIFKLAKETYFMENSHC